ncbi:MAG: cyclic nucleotide-binding domain-containing protein [Deltaproteobacteria bacterium]|nr:cyclic nucleotide-binding domain-containing protein [Deltaproteobacteria bacterium]
MSKDGRDILRIGLRKMSLEELVESDPLLLRSPVLAVLSEQERTGLLASSPIRSAAAGETILEEDSVSPGLLLVVDGTVVLSCAGGTVDLGTLSKGDFFGLASIIPDAAKPAAVAEGPVRLAVMPADQVALLAQIVPAFGALLTGEATKRRARASEGSSFFDRW